jgi:hypothetical protein
VKFGGSCLRHYVVLSPSHHSNELYAYVQQDRLEAGTHGSSALCLLGRIRPSCSASESISFLGGEALCGVNTFSWSWRWIGGGKERERKKERELWACALIYTTEDIPPRFLFFLRHSPFLLALRTPVVGSFRSSLSLRLIFTSVSSSF